MGTTLTAALVEGDEISSATSATSRAYLFRDGELKLLTCDHSLVEELRRQGRLTEEQAETHPQRSIITRALGPEAEVEVDTLTTSARPGDVYLICSDGLTTMVKDAKITEILADSPALDEATHLARERGERRRRQRQHHRCRLPPGGGRGAGGRRGRDAGRAQRRRGGAVRGSRAHARPSAAPRAWEAPRRARRHAAASRRRSASGASPSSR